MAVNFQFNGRDALVLTYLTQAERGRILGPQATDAWTFEFHPGHETGTPIYMRPKGCTVSSNLTKIDTRTMQGTLLAYDAGRVVNNEVIERSCKMKSGDKTAMFTVLQNNWALLADLAHRYKNGDKQG